MKFIDLVVQMGLRSGEFTGHLLGGKTENFSFSMIAMEIPAV